MSEGELQVPRLGALVAAEGFRLVAAMNPFDAVGTARIASAIYDRTCRLRMDYQDAADEAEIVRRSAPEPTVSDEFRIRAVELVRRTRSHPDVRVGSSVRGSIDLVLVAGTLAGLRGSRPDDPAVSLDAALTALSGRLRMHEGSARSSEDVVRELWSQVFTPPPEPEQGDPSPGEAPRPDPTHLQVRPAPTPAGSTAPS